MDPITIATTCASAVKIIAKLSAFVDEVSQVPDYVQKLQNELGAFYVSLSQIKLAVSRPRPLPDGFKANMDTLIQNVHDTLNELFEIVEKAQKLEVKKTPTQLWRSVLFTFKKPQVDILQKQLAAYNGIVTNMLLVLSDADGGRMAEKLDNIKSILEIMQSNRDNIKEVLVVLEQDDRNEAEYVLSDRTSRSRGSQGEGSTSAPGLGGYFESLEDKMDFQSSNNSYRQFYIHVVQVFTDIYSVLEPMGDIYGFLELGDPEKGNDYFLLNKFCNLFDGIERASETTAVLRDIRDGDSSMQTAFVLFLKAVIIEPLLKAERKQKKQQMHAIENLHSRRDHTQPSSDRPASCPVKCQLCTSSCAVTDHSYPLKKDTVHLCGQKHTCRHLCQKPGICEIATRPQSIESVFVGKHSTYQYTKYTQEARKLPCAVTLEPNQLEHTGVHVHSLGYDFHYCEVRCRHCGYYCTLPLGHPQNEHDTSHGSMSQTEWAVEGNEDAVLDLQGYKYATGDSGGPMLCSMVCKTLGRHVHIDTCRSGDDCDEDGVEHIRRRYSRRQQDWISHKLFWARSGFRDPYTRAEQAEFELCDHKCDGVEHSGCPDSYCTLPLFHSPANPNNPPARGHVSQDGHAYNCKHPGSNRRIQTSSSKFNPKAALSHNQ